jgi:hypothetical protein
VRSDLFAFAVIVYEMLTGSHPFVRPSAVETASAILRDDPPQRTVPGLPAGIAKILERCTQKEPSDRPGSARDLALFFEAAGAASEGTAAAPSIEPGEVRRIRTRALVVSSGLFILLCAATWGVVYVMAERTVTSAIEVDLARAERLVKRVERERSTAATMTARLVASFPELKALFETDAATIRDYLLSYLQRNPEIALLIALGPDARVVARTDDVSAGGDDNAGISALAGTAGEAVIVEIRGRPYHASAVVSEAGGNVFGYIVGAMPLDDAFATAVGDATQDEVLLLSDRGVLGSTLRSGEMPWQSRDEWRKAGGRADGAIDVDVGARRFAAREVVLADKPAVSAVVLESRDEAIAPFRGMKTGVIVIGLLGILVAVIGSVLIRRSLV